MIQRYRLAFLLSLLAFITLFAIYLNLPKSEKKLEKTRTKVIKVAFVSPVKKTSPAPVKTEKKKVTKPKILKKPKPKKIIKKKIVKKRVSKKKTVKKKIVKKIVKRVVKKKVIAKKIIHKPKPLEEHKSMVPPVYVAPKVVDEPVFKPQKTTHSQPIDKSQKYKEAFLRNVRSKIIAHKKYPKIAKRRHIEGSVKVRFDITINGEVSNIRFINGKRIFQKSIRKTLAQCFPMSIPNKVKGELPIQDVSVVLHFNIR